MAPRNLPNRSRNDATRFEGFESRHVALLGTASLALTALVGVFGYAVVPDRMAMRVTVGLDLDPTATQYLPRVLGLALLPALSALTLAADRLLRRLVDDLEDADPYYGLAVVATLGILLVCQVAVVAANAGGL